MCRLLLASITHLIALAHFESVARCVVHAAISASDTQAHAAECKAAGINDFLVKPFTYQQLRDRMKLWLDRAQSVKQADGANAVGDYQIAATASVTLLLRN